MAQHHRLLESDMFLLVRKLFSLSSRIWMLSLSGAWHCPVLSRLSGEMRILLLASGNGMAPNESDKLSKWDRNMALLIMVITCFLITLGTSQSCHTPEDFVAITSPGHIMIGGLFAIHEKMLSSDDHPRRPQIQRCVGWVKLKEKRKYT